MSNSIMNEMLPGEKIHKVDLHEGTSIGWFGYFLSFSHFIIKFTYITYITYIATKQLGGFTTDTLPRALRGRKVELTDFTTKVLGNIGGHHFLLVCSEFLIF